MLAFEYLFILYYINMSDIIEGVLERARTFQVPNWRYQSYNDLNPYKLASVGYSVISQDTLQCHMCQHQVTIGEDTEEALQQVILNLKAHGENCIYQNEAGSSISNEGLYLAMEGILAVIQKRSIKQNVQYPLINSRSLGKFVGSDEFLYRKILSLYEIDLKAFKISFILELTGWHITKNQQEEECLSCYYCGRQVPTAPFEKVSVDQQNVDKQELTSEARLFDPIEQHRYFCMWTGKEKGWMLYLQHLEDKMTEISAFKFKTPPLETKRMRVHLQKYLQNFRQKIEQGLQKLKVLTHQSANICEKLGEDQNLSISGEQKQRDVKRLRDSEHDIELILTAVNTQIDHPFKKIKLA